MAVPLAAGVFIGFVIAEFGHALRELLRSAVYRSESAKWQALDRNKRP
jgi:hypothetical protein